MTMEQKQCLLRYLGYYAGIIDGICGEQSQRATIDFQRAYMEQTDVDGIFGAATEKRILEVIATGEEPIDDKMSAIADWWKDIRYFTRAEFRCPCGKCGGFPVEPEEELVRVCDEIRRRLGVPVSIVDSGGSGVRCARHNADVGGVGNSNHLYGKAADLHSGKSPEEMARIAEEVLGDTGELGIYSWGIHVGVNCKYSRFYG